jgi:hypothetical protein
MLFDAKKMFVIFFWGMKWFWNLPKVAVGF